MRMNNKGFTLLEVLVAIAIIAILATIVGVNVANRPGEARITAATAQIRTFQSALQIYKMDNGAYPTQQQGLQALCVPTDVDPVPEKFPEEGYLQSMVLPVDPWKNPYIYLSPGSHGEPYEIITYGADGEPGGTGEAADISSTLL